MTRPAKAFSSKHSVDMVMSAGGLSPTRLPSDAELNSDIVMLMNTHTKGRGRNLLEPLSVNDSQDSSRA